MENSKGIINIEKSNKAPAITLRYANARDNCFALVASGNNPIEIVPLKNENDEMSGELPSFFDCNAIINVCIVDAGNEQVTPLLLGGTGDKREFYDNVIRNFTYFKNKIMEIGASNPHLFECKDIDEDVNEIMTDTLLAECLSQDNKCENCMYKRVFYENKDNGKATTQITDQEAQPPKDLDVDINPNQNQGKFYSQVHNSISELFEHYPSDDVLCKLIPESKFVKVDYENTGDYYSVGLISEEGHLKYICYAIPSKKGSQPPADLEGFSQWIEVDKDSGYWLMYQDAETGENVLTA